ncbi:hypothetical protein KRP22_015015 [Phytophthora ramorum]|nr:hypothetical protein KRP22_4797 [Phytophthora ramorum]
MATSTDSSGHTTRARSVETVDGYVSRGRAPPTSVPRDHAMLQDFTAYLELRLKSQNLSMLRRIFADFLNEHENTLVPMMRQGCTIVTIFPVLRTSARRRQEAEFLLAKPKWPLDSRGCVFLYLQYRTATRNMALLKHMFLQFVCQRETALMDFVQRGCQVISVIPFELPQLVPPVCQAPPPVQQVASDTAVVKKMKKRRTGRASVQRASPRVASPAVAQVEDVHKKKKRKLRRVSEIGEVTAAVADDSAQQEDVVAPRDPGGGVASAQAEEVQVPQKKKKGESRRVSGTGEATAATADDSAQRPDAVALSEPEGAAVSVQVGKMQMAQKKGKRRPHRAVKTRETTAAITHDSAQQQDVAAPSEPEGVAVAVQVGEVPVAEKKARGRPRHAVKTGETAPATADDSALLQDVAAPSEPEGVAVAVQVGEVPVAEKKARGRPRHAVKTGETAPATADDSALLQDVAAPSEPEGVAVAVQVGEVPVAEKKARGRPRHAVKTGETAPATADDSALLQDVAAPSEPEGVAVAVQVGEVPVAEKKTRGRPRHAVKTGETAPATADDSALLQDVAAPSEPEGVAVAVQVGEVPVAEKKTRGRPRHAVKTGETAPATADDSALLQDVAAPSEPEGVAVAVQVGEVPVAEKKTRGRPRHAVKTGETAPATADDSALLQDVAAPSEPEGVAVAVQVGEVPVAEKKTRGRPRHAVKTGETAPATADDSALLQDVAAPSEPEGVAVAVQVGEVPVAEKKTRGRPRHAVKTGETAPATADDSALLQDVAAPSEPEGVAVAVQVGEVPVAEKKTRGRPRHAVKTGETAPATADDSALLQDVAAPSEPEGVAVAVQVGEVPVAEKKTRGRPRHAVKTGETAPATADDSALLQDVAAPSEPEGVAVAVQVGEVPVAEKKTRGRPRHAVKTGETAPATADDSALLQDVAAPSEPEGVAVAVQVGEVPVAEKKTRGRPRHAVKTGETAPATADDSALLQDVAAPSEPEGVAVAVHVGEVPVAQTKIREIPDPAVKTGDKLAAIDDDLARVDSREPDGDSAPVQQKDSAAIEGPEEDAVAIEDPDNDASLSRQEDAAATGEPEIITKRHITPVAVSAPGGNEEAKTGVASCSSSVAVPTRKRGRKPKARAASDESEVTGAVTTAKPADGSLAESLEPPKAKRGRKRKVDNAVPINEKSRKRGKPAMSDAMCRSQLELTQKMEPFEAQIPWEAVYSNLPAPFDEPKHPELSRKFRKFWRAHGRAVWERNFWPPMSRKLSLLLFNKRNNRQLTAKNAFESIIISAYKELGAEFFVMLDTHKPRHPGWWYRGPVVALFALQQIKGESAVWDYVQKEALERFPDCRLALPLKAPNSGAVSKCHKRDSESMWMANHQLTPEILLAIAALKAGQQTCGEAEATEGDLMTAVDYLALL